MRRELKERFKEFGFTVIYIFGSSATGKRTPLSDIDIGVVFKNPPSGRDIRKLYNASYQLFSELYPGLKVDIVFLQAASLSLQYSAIKEGKIIFEEDPLFTSDYEYRIVNQYLDFRPVLDFFDRVVSERYVKT